MNEYLAGTITFIIVAALALFKIWCRRRPKEKETKTMPTSIFDKRQLPIKMNVEEAARLMSVSEGHLRKLMREEEITAKR